MASMLRAFDRYLEAGKRATRVDGPLARVDHVMKRIEPSRKAKTKKATFQGIPLEIDRPKGYVQEGKDPEGKAWRRLYRYDYGFIPKTEGGDGEGVDVFLGPSESSPISWWAIQTKEDGTFDEFKVMLGFSSGALAQSCYRMHIPARFCAGWVGVPVAFIKSLLGLEPRAVIKALRKAAIMTTKTKTQKSAGVQKIAGVSFETVTQAVAAALGEAYPAEDKGDGCCSYPPYPCEVYDDRVIYSKDGTYFEEAFTFADGKATLAGGPKPVVRQYVPAGANANAQAGAPVAQADNSAKSAEGAMGAAKTEKKNTTLAKAGGADIVALAAERLQTVADGLGKGEGTITAEIAAEIGAVTSLLETAADLYSGGAPTGGEGGEEGGDGADDLEVEMADLADAEKRGGIVKMSGPQLLAYAVAQMKKAKADPDPVRKAIRITTIEKALTYASYWSNANFQGDTDPTFPVAVMAEQGPTETNVTPGEGAPANLGPAAGGGATGVGGKTSQNTTLTGSSNFVEKMAEVEKMIADLRGGAPVAKNGEPVTKGTPGSTEPGLWPQSYVDTLPDSAFLYVEANANKSESGTTAAAFRHFPVRDVDGKLSKAQLAHAIKMIPTFGATPEFKADLLTKANGLFGLEASVEKSAAGASERGDDGWPDDMAAPDFLEGRKPIKAAATFGFDNLSEKAKSLESQG